MERNFLFSKDVPRTILCAVADFALVLCIGLVIDRWIYQATAPEVAHIQTVIPGNWAGRPNGGLIEDAATLDFGRVVEGNPVHWQLKLFNPTDQDVTIARFQGLCGAQIWTSSLTIPAGESGIVKLYFFNDIIRDPGSPSKKLEWHIVPEFAGHSGKHPGWWVGGTYCQSEARLEDEPGFQTTDAP